jgi:hypothetical protein
MAQLYPPYETILKFRQKPTEGELAMLDCLIKYLDDSYEVYFQPFINGDMPDIILLKEGHGAYIIEVKDWVLAHYRLDEVQDWFYRNDRIKSPFHQVDKYKQNLFNLHIEGLAEKLVLKSNYWKTVKCAVYFHNETTRALETFIKPGYPESATARDRYGRYIGFLSHFDYLGVDDLNERYATRIKTHVPFRTPDMLFDDETYKSLRRYLRPPRHTREEGHEIRYSKEQQKVIESKPNARQKVKGVAGSGKTHCLAKRAVNAHLRTHDKILILTFNITLRNYIHDKISEVRETFEWKNFDIVHFHEFFIALLNNSGVKEKLEHVLNQPELLRRLNCPKYDCVLIDEIQDYERPWTNFVKDYLLKEHGEFVVFGDEKQNIYERKMDEKERRPFTGIVGQWNLLRRSYRVSNNIAKLAELYQQSFFHGKYDLDQVLIVQKTLFPSSHLEFHALQEFSALEIWGIIRKAITRYEIHDNDVCIQASKVEPLRRLEEFVNEKHGIRTASMFESQKVYDTLCSYSQQGEPDKARLNDIRRSKKFHFWNNPGTMKFCTIHSYKGWEIDTLVLLLGSDLSIDDDSEYEYVSDELVYTAITRCRSNLILIEVGSNKYQDFFKKNMAVLTDS